MTTEESEAAWELLVEDLCHAFNPTLTALCPTKQERVDRLRELCRGLLPVLMRHFGEPVRERATSGAAIPMDAKALANVIRDHTAKSLAPLRGKLENAEHRVERQGEHLRRTETRLQALERK